MMNLTKKQAKDYLRYVYDSGIRFSIREGKDDRTITLHINNMVWVVARVDEKYGVIGKLDKQQTEYFMQSLLLNFEFYARVASIIGYGIEILQPTFESEE